MPPRNIGQPIQQLDPFAIQVAQPTISVPNLPSTKYYANTQDLENIARSLQLIGQSAYQYARIREGQRADEQRQAVIDQRAESGAGRQAGTIDRSIMEAAFNDDTLDTTISVPGDAQKGIAPVSEEDELLQLMAETGDPTRALQEFVTSRIAGPMSQLQSETARQAYFDEVFPPVFKAGMAWVNRREAARQEMLREDLAIELAASDDSPSIPDLMRLSKESNSLEPLEESDAVGLVLQAAEIASARDRHDRARSLLGLVPERKRTAAWYEAADATEQRFLDGAGRLLTSELRGATFADGGMFTALFGPGTTPDDELLEQVDLSVKSLLADPGFNADQQRRRLYAAQAAVDPLGRAFTIIGTAARQIETEADDTMDDIRKENRYQAELLTVRLLTESVIAVTTDGQSVTIDLENPEANTLMRQHLISKYGEDGYKYFDDYLALRGNKRYTAEKSEPDQNIHASTLLAELRDIGSNSERARFLREDVSNAARNGMITHSQYRALISDAQLMETLQPEFESAFFRETKRSLGQAFANALGVGFEFDVSGNLNIKSNPKIDPAAYGAFNKMIGGFRNRYSQWLRSNMKLREEDPNAFRLAQDDWLMGIQQEFFDEAVRLGTYHSAPEYQLRKDSR